MPYVFSVIAERTYSNLNHKDIQIANHQKGTV